MPRTVNLVVRVYANFCQPYKYCKKEKTPKTVALNFRWNRYFAYINSIACTDSFLELSFEISLVKSIRNYGLYIPQIGQLLSSYFEKVCRFKSLLLNIDPTPPEATIRRVIKGTLAHVSSCEYCKIFKNVFFT